MLYCCACGVRCEHCSLHLVQQVRCVRGFPITGHAHFWDLETRTAYIRTAAGCFTCVSGHLLLLASWWFVTLRGADYWDDSGLYNLCKHLTCRHTPSTLTLTVRVICSFDKKRGNIRGGGGRAQFLLQILLVPTCTGAHTHFHCSNSHATVLCVAAVWTGTDSD